MTAAARPTIALRKNLSRAIRQGAPWIFRDALVGAPQAPDGAVVTVTSRDGRPLGTGFWDVASPIAVRVLSAGKVDDLASRVRERVASALERRLGFIDRDRTTAFRWIHGEADGLPGIHVDLYGTVASVRFDGAGARAFYADLPAWLTEAGRSLPLSSVLERASGLAPAAVRWGRAPAGEIEVRENGLRFGVDLMAGQKGGLFLDQRDNRVFIGERARGKRVLNLFGYTGGFSVHAAAGGASETTTVDTSRPALEAARRNFARNGLSLEHATFVAADAFAFLEEQIRRGRRWDIVISDPPSFAPSRAALGRAQQAYGRLHRSCAAVVELGGLFCAASCSSHVGRPLFRKLVAEGVGRSGRRFALVEERGAAPDHPVIAAFPEGDYLKLVIGRID